MSNLIDYLPERYRNSPEIVELQQVLQTQADKLIAARDGRFQQFFIREATWGLRLWETALGIETDLSKPYSYRRTRIESKLRGLGTTTVAMIKNVAESFSNGAVEVIEHNGEYYFEIKFVGTFGIPPNMDDLTAAIEEIKPAHLGYAYLFIYPTWDDYDAFDHTWDEWDAAGLTWDELELYKGG